MTLVALAGFNGVRITQTWKPGETVVSPADKAILRNVTAAAQLDRHPGADECDELRQRDDAADAAGPGRLRRVRRLGRHAPIPDLTRVIVGNEPNLNRYWLPQFNADGSDAAAPAYEALLAQTYDAIKAVAPNVDGDRRRGLAARQRQPEAHAADALADGLHHATSAPPTARAAARRRSWTPSRSIRTRTTRASRRRRACTRTRPRSRSPTTASSSSLLGIAFDGTAQARLDAADLLRRVRRRVADPGREAGPLHRHGAGDDEAGRRGDPGRLLPPGDPARVLPAERPRHLPLPRVRRDCARRLAVGPLLRRRHAEDEPGSGPPGDGRVTPRSRRGVPRAAARRPKAGGDADRRGADAQLRSRLRVRRRSSTACRGSCSRRSAAARPAGCRPGWRCACRSRKRPYRLRISLTAPVNPGRSTLLVVPLRRG